MSRFFKTPVAGVTGMNRSVRSSRPVAGGDRSPAGRGYFLAFSAGAVVDSAAMKASWGTSTR
ncbi:MAG: hypothetical protein KDB63_14970, partial [Nocardioidaceae bacterium]|nr:hypothetical protein [Nocardioidaceae bacterium]